MSPPAAIETNSFSSLSNGHSAAPNGYANGISQSVSKFGQPFKTELKNNLVSEIKSRLQQELKADLKQSLVAQYRDQLFDEIKEEARVELLTQIKKELQLDAIAEVKQSTSVSTFNEPPPSIFTPICHPRVDDAIREVDGYYLKYWPFPNEKARKKFVAAGFSRVTCLYFPKALDERINFACSLLTILFLVDDQLEDMSLADGKAYNESLMPFCRGDVLPDRNVPVQWMMYDLWEDMRKCDKELAEEVVEPVFEFMRAQTAKERLTIKGLGRYLEYRQADVGQGLLAALMRFSYGLRLTSAELESLTPVDKNTGRHISIINDIYSYEKELLSSKTGHVEGSFLCSCVPIFAEETEISIAAAKNVLYVLAREWEIVHRRMVEEREKAGCNETISRYMEGLEYHMSGNELWSRTTKRYSEVALGM